jgi:hypothetical protein
MAGGTALSIPQIGEAYEPGKVYVLRAKFGYGDTGNTAGGASDGLDMWSDTQETVNLINVNSSNVVIHKIEWYKPTAFTASVTMTLGPSTNNDEFGTTTNLAATEATSAMLGDTSIATTTIAQSYQFGSTTTIDLVCSGADIAAGILELYLLYSFAPPEQSDSGGSSNT